VTERGQRQSRKAPGNARGLLRAPRASSSRPRFVRRSLARRGWPAQAIAPPCPRGSGQEPCRVFCLVVGRRIAARRWRIGHTQTQSAVCGPRSARCGARGTPSRRREVERICVHWRGVVRPQSFPVEGKRSSRLYPPGTPRASGSSGPSAGLMRGTGYSRRTVRRVGFSVRRLESPFAPVQGVCVIQPPTRPIEVTPYTRRSCPGRRPDLGRVRRFTDRCDVTPRAWPWRDEQAGDIEPAERLVYVSRGVV